MNCVRIRDISVLGCYVSNQLVHDQDVFLYESSGSKDQVSPALEALGSSEEHVLLGSEFEVFGVE
jgi:hypothetical protein